MVLQCADRHTYYVKFFRFASAISGPMFITQALSRYPLSDGVARKTNRTGLYRNYWSLRKRLEVCTEGKILLHELCKMPVEVRSVSTVGRTGEEEVDFAADKLSSARLEAITLKRYAKNAPLIPVR